MSGNAAGSQPEFPPGVRVVYGWTFDGAPYQITLEDEKFGLGSTASIRKGCIWNSEPIVVAVKVFGELLTREKQELLFRELHFAREVSMCHPSILAFIGTAALGEQTAIVSLYMKNGNLRQYMNSNPQCNKKTLILQVADAVEFLHVEKKLVHGDLKCENVLVSDFGNALLADFGLSSFVEKSESLSTTMTAIRAMHTLQFAAPELLGLLGEDEPPVSKKTTASDIYAFGMLILEAISEQPPWGNKTNFAVISSVSARKHPPRPTVNGIFVTMSHSWWDVCRSCWSFVSRERPQISHVIHALEAAESAPYRDLPVDEDIECAAYMPDGTAIVVAYSVSVMLIDSTSGHIRQQWRDLPEHLYAAPRMLAVSRDGQHIAYSCNKTILVLDATSRVPMTSLQHDGVVCCVAYSRDSTRIAAGTARGLGRSGSTIRLWDAATGAVCGQNLSGHTADVDSVSFSPDGSCLASSDWRGIRLWDSRTCTLIATLERPGDEDDLYGEVLNEVIFLQDGNIAAMYDDDVVLVRDVRSSATMQCIWQRSSDSDRYAFAISPSGRYIATGPAHKGVQLWDVQEKCHVGGPLIRCDGFGDLACIAFSPDWRSIVLARDDGPLRVWDLFD